MRHALVPAIGFLATGQLGQFQQHLHGLGLWAPIVSITLMLAEALAVPIPVTIIMAANGLVFGTWRGMLVSFAGGLLGAMVAYALARRFGRALIERMLPAASLRAGDRLMAKYGRWALVLERWIPGVPGDPISYAAGLTRMPFAAFLLATTAGLLPSDLVAAYLGVQVAGDVPLRYWFGGLMLVVIGWAVWRLVRRRATRSGT